jgi:hypothetical protein
MIPHDLQMLKRLIALPRSATGVTSYQYATVSEIRRSDLQFWLDSF